MARVPPIEAVLLQAYNALQVQYFEDKGKTVDKLKRLGLPWNTHIDSVKAVVEELFTALGLEPESRNDAFMGFIEMANFYMALEKRIWTNAATKTQIAWYLAAYFWAPSMARRIAFWNLEGAQDTGMPGGRFWYLPEIRTANGQADVVSPVAQVVEWLLDLQGQTMDVAAPGLGSNKVGEDDRIERVLYNWLAGDLPRVDNIESYFGEGSVLEFKGTFLIDQSESLSEKFERALLFIKRKKLSVESLRQEIPMSQPGRIESVLSHEATDVERAIFCDLLANRYMAPTLRTIRQRLRIARMSQYAYVEFGKLLQGKAFDPKLADPSVNKELQLASIFTDVYNRTLDAYKNCESMQAENQWFERKLPPWHSEGIYRAILPLRQHGAVDAVADLINRRFEDMQADAPLEDHVGHTAELSKSLVVRDLQRLKKDQQDQLMALDFSEKLKSKPHTSISAKVKNFRLAKEVALQDSCSLKVRRIALHRAKKLATTSAEQMAVICIELSQLLNAPDHEFRPKDSQTSVHHLLDQAKSNEAYRYWSAMVLQFEAKHYLAMNMMETAQKLFGEALEACQTQSFGKLRGEIARDAFATVVEFQRNGFDLTNQEKYYRNMMSFETVQLNMNEIVPVFEDVAIEVSEYFWDSLYVPYDGLETVSPISREKWEKITKDTMTMIAQADWVQLQAWFIKNKAYLDKRLGDVRANTVLIGWLKLLYDEEAKQSRRPAFLRSDPNYKTEKPRPTLQRWRRGIEMLVATSPKAVNLHDFKRQMPLMLAANAGDEAMVRALLNGGADAEKVDFLGRTALHAAVAKRSLPSVVLILDAFPQTAFVKTTDGLCALHTALRIGDASIVEMLFRNAPETLSIKSNAGQTPLDLAKFISSDPNFLKDLRSYMTSERRFPGTEAEYRHAALTLLKLSPPESM